MNKKSMLVLLLGVLWLGGGNAEEEQEKIEPPDWYKAGVVAAMQDRNSDFSTDEFSFVKDTQEWLPFYLSPEKRKIIVDKVIDRLADKDSNVHITAINELVKLQAKEAIPNIIDSLGNNDSIVQHTAITALVNFQANGAIDKLIALSLTKKENEDSHFVRIPAIDALGKLQAKGAIDNLIEILKTNDDQYENIAVIQALAQLQAEKAIPEIIKHLNNPDASEVIEAATKALIQLNVNEKDAITIIESLTNADYPYERPVSAAARSALVKFQSRKEIIPKLVEWSVTPGDENSYARDALVQLKAEEAIPQLIVFLNNKHERNVRQAAIYALADLKAEKAIPEIVKFLADKDDSGMRYAAIEALKKLDAKSKIPEIEVHLTDDDVGVQGAAIEALVQLQGKEAISKIAALLTEEMSKTPRAAIDALEQLQAKEVIPYLKKWLASLNTQADKDKSTDYYEIFSYLLKKLQALPATEAIPEIIKTLSNNNSFVRSDGIVALEKLTDKNAILDITACLEDKDGLVRKAKINALATLQGKDAIPTIVDYLINDPNWYVRETAIKSLAILQGKEAIPIIKKALGDTDQKIRETALAELIQLQAKEVIPDILEHLTSHVQSSIKQLLQIQAEEEQFKLLPQAPFFIAIHNTLASIYGDELVTTKTRLTAHLLAGSRFQILVWCLGNNDKQDCSKQTFLNDHEKTVNTLVLFKDFYQAIPKDKFSPKLRDDLVVKINVVAEALVDQQTELTFAKLREELTASQSLKSTFNALYEIFSAKEEVSLLDDISQLITKDGYDINDLKRKRDAILETQKWLQQIFKYSGIFCLHLSFWIMLVFLYPRSRMIQAIFFWNPWVQRIVGLGYIGFCLTWIPFLRRRLLSPLKDSLLADANLAAFKPELYFANMSITLKGLNQPQPLLVTLAKFRGQIILEGESGLGKTMYLRYLAQHSTRPFAFLHATRCNAGVIPALKEKLHGFARNETFLTSIIYAGGVDLCIDGLNEVSPDTRAKITQFVEQHFKGTILLSTQPLEWQPPQTAKTYRLLPLNREQIEAFLLSRPEQPDHYRQTCIEYLNTALSSQLDYVLYELHLKILSNPMDLTVVGHLLAQNIQPNLSSLIEQQYQTMNEEYQRKAFNQNFPLNKFAQHVFEIRLQDKRVLNHVDFGKELDCLAEHKLVIKRTEKQAETEQENYYFRHDKIWDFFNAYVFKQHDNEWRKAYFADERFRGAFLALAWSLPLNDAQGLLAELQHYIVQTNDNILHHQYYQLLDLRNRLLHSGV